MAFLVNFLNINVVNKFLSNFATLFFLPSCPPDFCSSEQPSFIGEGEACYLNVRFPIETGIEILGLA